MIKEHLNNTLLPLEGNSNVIINPQLGDMVRSYMAYNSIGVVVEKIDENGVKVLWNDFHNNFESIFRNPCHLNYTQIAKDIFPVEPMPQGAAIQFYLDDQFEEKK